MRVDNFINQNGKGMDALYQHIKTGEKKRLPPKVYDAVKKQWRPIPEPKTEVKLTTEVDQTSTVVFEPTQDLDISAEQSESAEPTKESLQAEYELLSGEKPDGRWSVKKLQEKIQETKGSK